jgi:hypothetical protein
MEDLEAANQAVQEKGKSTKGAKAKGTKSPKAAKPTKGSSSTKATKATKAEDHEYDGSDNDEDANNESSAKEPPEKKLKANTQVFPATLPIRSFSMPVTLSGRNEEVAAQFVPFH